MLWFGKLSSQLLISLGIALLLLPFQERWTGEKTREIVLLKVQEAPFTQETLRRRFADSFVEFSYGKLSSYPEMLDVVLGTMGTSTKRCVSALEWRSLITAFPALEHEMTVYSFRDGVYQIRAKETQKNSIGDVIVCFETINLGLYNNPDWGSLPLIGTKGLESYPALQAELARCLGKTLPVEETVDVSPRKWKRFRRQQLQNGSYGNTFIAQGKSVSGWIQKELRPWSVEMPWLREVCRILGAIAVLAGLGMGIRYYRFTDSDVSISVSSTWLALFCDFLLIAGGTFFTALFFDALWVGLLGQQSFLGLESDWVSSQSITGLHFISIPALFIALPLLSLFFTSLTAQRLRISSKGITSLGAIGNVSITWEDLMDVSIREQSNPLSFTVMDFRSLQRVVDLKGPERIITINEPNSSHRKRAIVNELVSHTPESKRRLLDKLEKW